MNLLVGVPALAGPGPLTRRVDRFMVPMHGTKVEGLFHDHQCRAAVSPAFSRARPDADHSKRTRQKLAALVGKGRGTIWGSLVTVSGDKTTIQFVWLSESIR